jgi:hypothetical protein
MRGVACVAAAIGRAHVRDPRIGMLGLDLERGNEGVLGVEDEVSSLSLSLQSDRESHGYLTSIGILHKTARLGDRSDAVTAATSSELVRSEGRRSRHSGATMT